MATIDLGKIKLVWRGTYSTSNTYTADDLVEYTDNGVTSTFIAVAASSSSNQQVPSSSGTVNTSHWQLIAKGVADPIPSQSGHSGKVLGTNGSALSWVTDQGGKLLQAKHSFNTSIITVTHSGTTSDTYGLQGGRVYGDLNTITITPTSATSTMIIQGLSGMTDAGAGTYSGNGAFGVVAVLDNGTSNNIDNTDYQYYPETGTFGTGYYPPNVVVQGSYASGNTNAQTWRLKGYTYRESGTDVSKFRRSSLLIMEVDI
jgi:hypothetical protein